MTYNPVLFRLYNDGVRQARAEYHRRQAEIALTETRRQPLLAVLLRERFTPLAVVEQQARRDVLARRKDAA